MEHKSQQHASTAWRHSPQQCQGENRVIESSEASPSLPARSEQQRCAQHREQGQHEAPIPPIWMREPFAGGRGVGVCPSHRPAHRCVCPSCPGHCRTPHSTNPTWQRERNLQHDPTCFLKINSAMPREARLYVLCCLSCEMDYFGLQLSFQEESSFLT